MLENLKITFFRRKHKTGESQGQIGMKAGILEGRLSTIVTGKAQATPKERAALAEALGETEEYLFFNFEF